METTEEDSKGRTRPNPYPRQPLDKGFLGKIYPFLVDLVERGAVLEIPSSWKRGMNYELDYLSAFVQIKAKRLYHEFSSATTSKGYAIVLKE